MQLAERQPSRCEDPFPSKPSSIASRPNPWPLLINCAPRQSRHLAQLQYNRRLPGAFRALLRGLAMPRLLGADGAIRTGAIRFLSAIMAIAAMASVAIVVSAGQIADAIDQLLDTDAGLIRDLLRLAVLFALLQLAAGQLAAVSLIRGQRFIPAVAPSSQHSLVGSGCSPCRKATSFQR